jgi:hypothetical protein
MRTIQAILICVVVLMAGCKDNSMGPAGGQGQNVLVKVTAAPGSPADGVRMLKAASGEGVLASVDSITVAGALLVIKDISFTSDVDTMHTRDSIECEREDDFEEHESEAELRGLHFRGPFLVSLQSNTPVQVVLDTIPAGTYNGIRFAIHRVRHSDIMKNASIPDSLAGLSIVLGGTVAYANGTVAPFLFKTDLNEEFKVKGNFVVMPGDKLVPYVLNFDLASWFKDSSGRTFDPNDPMDRYRIRNAIRAALGGRVHGGRDDDDDGRPD